MPKIEAIRVRKEFEGVAGQRTVAVDDLSFAVDEGECVCVVGRTGCGKSTLLSMMLGLEISEWWTAACRWPVAVW